jgi:hypothetical protein
MAMIDKGDDDQVQGKRRWKTRALVEFYWREEVMRRRMRGRQEHDDLD